MIKQPLLVWLLLLVLFLCSNVQAEPMSPSDMACPVVKDTDSSGKLGDMPGSADLRKGIVWLDQGRYAAAYTALENAINQGLPDSIERAHVYQQMGLLMCRLDSSELCQRNFKLAFMTNGIFELPIVTLQLPHVRDAYGRAQQFFESKCVTIATRTGAVEAQANVAKTTTETNIQTAVQQPDRVSLTMVSGKNLKKMRRSSDEATILLRIKPWAIVSIDNSEVVTPPVKELKIKPGTRMITIKHPNFKPILIETNFKRGEAWVVRQIY